MRYSVPFYDLATGAVADTYLALVGLKVPNTTGLRCKLHSLFVAPSDDAPDDKNFAIRLHRVTTYAANGTGSTQITAANIPKKDPNSRNCEIEAYRAYATNPTTLDTEPVFHAESNDRGQVYKDWVQDGEDPPQFLLNQMGVLLAAPRAAQAIRLSGTLELEVF